MLTDLQRAAITNALRTLEQKRDYDHPSSVIRRVAGADALKAIRQLYEELVEANKLNRLAAGLSAGAAEYDLEVRQLVIEGKRAQRSGNRSAEMRVSKRSERLEESFEERVPEEDRPKFLRSQGDSRTWDDRWSFMDFRPPLLRPEFTGNPIEHPMNVAQRTILAELSETDRGQMPEHAKERLSSTLRLVRSAE